MINRIPGYHGTGFTPFSFFILYGWIAIGFLSIIMFGIKEQDHTISAMFEPPVFELIAGLMIAIGAVFMLLSANDWENVRVGWSLDNIGMIIAIGGWILFLIAIFPPRIESVIEFAVCVTFIGALVTRFLFTQVYERFIKARVVKIWKTGSIQEL